MTVTEQRPAVRAGEDWVAGPADSLASVPESAWDALVPSVDEALRRRFLLAWEEVDLAGLRSRPIVVSAPGRDDPVAACPAYWYDLDLVSTRMPAAAGPLAHLRRLWPRLGMARTYEMGSPTPLTNPFLVGTERREETIRAIGEAGLAEADRGRAAFTLVQNLTSLDGPAARALLPLGFVGVPILPTVVVDLPYRSFDEYLSAMRSQYRRRARQTLDRSDHLRVEHRRDFAELADDLAGLWRLIYERARELRREILTPAYFREVAAVPTTSVLLLRRPDHSIASFALMLDDHPWTAFLQCGFDEEAARSEGAYFRLLYEIVRSAIEGGFSRVELGMTTVAPKLDVGGVPVPLFALVRHRNTVIHGALRRAARGWLRPEPVSARRVFKEPPPTAADLVADRQRASADG